MSYELICENVVDRRKKCNLSEKENERIVQKI